MSKEILVSGLITYICFLIALSFHEFAHGWMANRCGDHTARFFGRLTLNPLAHIDMIGTVLIPLSMIFLTASNPRVGAAISGFVIGWARPVPVNPLYFRNPGRDDNLVSLAGPVANLIQAFLALALVRILFIFFAKVPDDSIIVEVVRMLFNLAFINILLCWFNLLPIPPLDGSHIYKNLTGMSTETYYRIAQYGFILIIVAINIPLVRNALSWLMENTLWLMEKALFF